MTKFVCVADTHRLHEQIIMPEGDVLLHGGDIGLECMSTEETKRFNKWLGTLPYEHKILIPGNHDFYAEKNPALVKELLTNGTLLIDEMVTVRGFRIYGSPWQPWFFNWAWNLQRGPEIATVWDKIPDDTDILITHGPPLERLDKTLNGDPVGCADLKYRLTQLNQLKAHIFGHIHPGYGLEEYKGVQYVNASTCNEAYEPVNPPIVIEL